MIPFDIKPVNGCGVYITQNTEGSPAEIGYSFWNGFEWGITYGTLRDAALWSDRASPFQNKNWKGIS